MLAVGVAVVVLTSPRPHVVAAAEPLPLAPSAIPRLIPPDVARAHASAADLFKRLGAELDGEIVCVQFPERVDCSALISGRFITLTCNAEGCRP
jgi:hypothetical protein